MAPAEVPSPRWLQDCFGGSVSVDSLTQTLFPRLSGSRTAMGESWGSSGHWHQFLPHVGPRIPYL